MVNPPVAKCSTIKAPEGTLDPNHKSTEHGTPPHHDRTINLSHWNQSTEPQPSCHFCRSGGNEKKLSALMQLSRDFLDCPTACYQHAPILDGIKYMKRNMLTSTPVSVSVSSCEGHQNPERCGNIRGIESFLQGRWIESFLYRALVQENLQLQSCQNLPALALCLKRLCLLEPCVRALKCGR